MNKLSTVTTAGDEFPQFNVIFTACEDKGAACGGAHWVVIRAQVNFEGGNGATNPATLNVTKTWVQSWSVNR